MRLLYRFGKYIMPCLLGIALAGTIAAVFAPYAVEILLGLAALCLAGFALCYNTATGGKLIWSDYIASLAIALSFLLTLLLIVGGYLQLYTVIEGINLLVILGISIALLYNSHAKRKRFFHMNDFCPGKRLLNNLSVGICKMEILLFHNSLYKGHFHIGNCVIRRASPVRSQDSDLVAEPPKLLHKTLCRQGKPIADIEIFSANDQYFHSSFR